LFYLCIYKIT